MGTTTTEGFKRNWERQCVVQFMFLAVLRNIITTLKYTYTLSIFKAIIIIYAYSGF